MKMGCNQNEITLDLAQRIEPVTEVSLLILAFIYVTVFFLEYGCREEPFSAAQ